MLSSPLFILLCILTLIIILCIFSPRYPPIFVASSPIIIWRIYILAIHPIRCIPHYHLALISPRYPLCFSMFFVRSAIIIVYLRIFSF